MVLSHGLRLSFENDPPPADSEFVAEALGTFNAPFLRNPAYSYFAVMVRDEANAIRAGLVGNTYAGWLFIQYLWVDAALRRGRIGGGLIAEAEKHAVAQGCHAAFVDTFSFQAPGFYRRQGYREFARLDYPPDHQRIFLRKQLNAETAHADAS
ncbi:MAG: GNAT family N-acetyltransferase [Alphaproteobacteria bacterium]|nr:GNAT family N-acetyltransferase [Alphaproteobacteria bacterium]